MNQFIASSRNGRVFHRVTRALAMALCFVGGVTSVSPLEWTDNGAPSFGSPALAQTAAPKRASGISVQDQLDMDITPLPTGYGAVFVPSPGVQLTGATVLVQNE